MKQKRLKIGTKVRLTKDCLEWLQKNADEIYGYPRLIRPDKENSIEEQLSEYFMNKYSLERELSIDGVIVGDNGDKHDFAYLVWTANELGQDLAYYGPEDLELL